jgi:DNA polymerase
LVPQWGFPPLPDDAWIDSMHRASAANLPQGLDVCAKFLKMPFDVDKKDSTRIKRITNLIKTPIPATISDILNGRAPYEVRYQKTTAKLTLFDDMQWLADRCQKVDIVLEEAILLKLPPWPQMLPWVNIPRIDREINDRGIMLDVPLLEGLKSAAQQEIKTMNAALSLATGSKVESVTKVEDLKVFLVENGVELPSNLEPIDPENPDPDEDIKQMEADNARKSPWKLNKYVMANLLGNPNLPEHCRAAVAIRAEAAKVSVQKFTRMLNSKSPDGYLRNTQTLGGAQQTLRWASKGCNLYNTVRDVFGNPDEIAELHGLDAKADKVRIAEMQPGILYDAIMVGRRGNPDEIRERYQRVRKDAQGRPQTLGVMTWISRMTRRTLAARAGNLLLNGDFAQVEARITVWLAQQRDIVQAFAGGQDVYRTIAAKMYKCTPESLSKQQRQSGKVTMLASSFGGAHNALMAMAHQQGMLMVEGEARENVKDFRGASPDLMKYLYAVDDTAAKAVQYPGYEFPIPPLNIVSYFMQGDCLCARLPSGRLLRYWYPRLTQEYWPDGRAKNRLSLSGISIKGRAVFRRSLYHTILVENITQAIGADMLATALVNLDQAGLPVNLHVYDSCAGEVPEEQALQLAPVFEQAMLDQPDWTHGLPIGADVEIGARFG